MSFKKYDNGVLTSHFWIEVYENGELYYIRFPENYQKKITDIFIEDSLNYVMQPEMKFDSIESEIKIEYLEERECYLIDIGWIHYNADGGADQYFIADAMTDIHTGEFWLTCDFSNYTDD